MEEYAKMRKSFYYACSFKSNLGTFLKKYYLFRYLNTETNPPSIPGESKIICRAVGTLAAAREVGGTQSLSFPVASFRYPNTLASPPFQAYPKPSIPKLFLLLPTINPKAHHSPYKLPPPTASP